jgi:hypothetical protein
MASKDCAGKDYPALEAEAGKGEPARLLIEIALRPPSLPALACDPGEVQRAIRDGFREVLTQRELERLAEIANPPRSRARRWIGRAFAFVISAAVGSAATLLLSASHAPRPYAVGLLTPPPGDSRPSSEVARPDSQSAGAPAASSARPSAPSAGPARFGLNQQ